ncbi:MAG: putative Fe-S cluster assembly protein SufT [Thermoanaerobaculia bacterium]|nr:MAG: putative Fe-S cluster assembly protein SufT [Thermoanaerobaculia bacterium]
MRAGRGRSRPVRTGRARASNRHLRGVGRPAAAGGPRTIYHWRFGEPGEGPGAGGGSEVKPGTEEILLERELSAIVIPHGYRTSLPKGTKVRVLQTLGDSATVSADFGGLFRIDPDDFPAIGLSELPQPDREAELSRPLEERVWDVLRSCYDPEIPVNIVELGLIYDCRVDPPAAGAKSDVHVKMTLTAPGCGMGDVLAADIQHKLEKMADVGRAEVEVVFDPPWNQSMMSEAARLQLGFF